VGRAAFRAGHEGGSLVRIVYRPDAGGAIAARRTAVQRGAETHGPPCARRGHAGRFRPPSRPKATSITAPTEIAESATLNAGQAQSR